MKGKLYGVGVGPGDPSLMTYKAAQCIEQVPVIAVPTSGGNKQIALEIVAPYLSSQEILHCYMPMTRDKEALTRIHEACANQIQGYLDAGKDVAFLTLGDPTIYSTYIYIHKHIVSRGYEASMIPGVPSFCAVAAKLGNSLCEEGEILHIIPASYEGTEAALGLKGNKVLMKTGKSLKKVFDLLKQKGLYESAQMVSCCGMKEEKIYPTLKEVQEESSYFSIVVVKEE